MCSPFQSQLPLFKSLPNGKILALSKLKDFADDKVQKHDRKNEICSEGVKNIEGKVQAFSPFPTMFSRGFFHRVMKTWHCVGRSLLFTERQNFGLYQIESIGTR